MLNIKTESVLNSEISNLEGLWWIDGTESIKQYGVLNFDAATGGVLQVRGQLRNDIFESGEVTIFGECNGRLFTLLYAQLTDSELKMDKFGTTIRQEYFTNLILGGIHTPHESDTKFDSFKFATHQLESWLATKDYVIQDLEDSYELTINKRSNIEISIEGDITLSIVFEENTSRGKHELTFRRCPYFEVKSKEGMSINEFRKTIYVPLLSFMCIATGGTEYVYKLDAKYVPDVNSEAPREVSIFSTFRMAAMNSKPSPAYKHWIEPDNSFEEVCGYLNRWMNLYLENELILEEYFAGKYGKNYYLEDQFFRIVKTVESWSRNVIPEGKYITEEHDIILRKVRPVLSDAEYNQIAKRFNSKLIFRDYFSALISKQEPKLCDYLHNKELFLTKLVNTRNKYVHVVPKNELFTADEMFVTKNFLELILIHELLDAVGLPRESISSKTDICDQFQAMKQYKSIINNISDDHWGN